MNKPHYITPLPGFVLVKPLKEEKIGAMIVSDQMNDKDSAGVVVAIGRDWIYHEGSQAISVHCPVELGNKIIYQNIGTNAYRDFKTGEILRLVRFHVDPVYTQIIATINE